MKCLVANELVVTMCDDWPAARIYWASSRCSQSSPTLLPANHFISPHRWYSPRPQYSSSSSGSMFRSSFSPTIFSYI